MLLAAVVGVLLAGCREARPAHPGRWATAWTDALNSHRLLQVSPLLAAAATYQDPLTAGPLAAPQWAYHWARIWAAFPDQRFAVQHVRGDAHTVTVEWVATGMGAGGYADPLKGVFVLDLEDERIAAVRGYFDARLVTPPRK